LASQGVNIEELGLSDVDEPVVYDLYAVDEHLGVLGGGHYRAYAYNHETEQWHHFDDSYVSIAKPEAAINANAYLLFYKRRTSRPLGGKTYAKIQEARNRRQHDSEMQNTDPQLPTPPSEPAKPLEPPSVRQTRFLSDLESREGGWLASSNGSSSSASSPPPLDERDSSDPPTFEDSRFDEIVQTNLEPLDLAAHHFAFPDPTARFSPSSVEAEPDNSSRLSPASLDGELDAELGYPDYDGEEQLPNRSWSQIVANNDVFDSDPSGVTISVDQHAGYADDGISSPNLKARQLQLHSDSTFDTHSDSSRALS